MDQPPLTHNLPLAVHGLLVVDDHELLRLGLRTLVQSHAASSGQAVQVFEARGLQDALTVYRDHQSEIALTLLDLHLPDAHGLSGLTSFVAQFPEARVVVLSGVNDPALVREALANGASAYLTKSGDLQEVVRYIGELGLPQLRGCSPRSAVDSNAVDQAGDRADPQRDKALRRVLQTAAGDAVQISGRQAQILDLVLVGLSNRDIADKAHLSEGTVKNHVSALLLLFDVHSRAQLVSLLR
jgi:DNA-binding NarL/FixJ family response regulator